MTTQSDKTEAVSSEERILRLRDVMRLTGMSRSWIYREVAAKPPRFPRPIKLGRASCWSQSEVLSFVRLKLEGEGR